MKDGGLGGWGIGEIGEMGGMGEMGEMGNFALISHSAHFIPRLEIPVVDTGNSRDL